MNILVTGAQGFIGGYLVQALLAQGDRIYALGRGEQRLFSKNHIDIQADLSTPGWTSHLPAAVDVVVHLAQSRRYREFPAGAVDMVRVNVDTTLELLEWAREQNVNHFLFASTGNVYRSSSQLLVETDECQPNSMYAATKLSAEYIVQQYQDFFSTTILRIFGAYGPGQRGMIVPNMVARVRARAEITLGQGIGLCFTPLYIDDCVKMIQMLIQSGTDKKNEIYNLAGNEVVQLGDLVRLIATYTSLSAHIRRTDTQPSYLLGDNQKICQAIQFTPQVSLSAGIRLVLQQEGNLPHASP